MFTIDYIFDSAPAQDSSDPLGSITIRDARKALTLANVFLDSAFVALIDGLREVRAQGHSVVEMPEEPDALRLDPGPGGTILIAYQGQRVVAPGPDALESALRRITGSFLNDMAQFKDFERNSALEPVRRFCASEAE
jgi:hypothetical protein